MTQAPTTSKLHRPPTHPGAILREDVLSAVRLGKFCGNGSGLWLRMQQAFDLWHAEQNLREELEKIPAHGVR